MYVVVIAWRFVGLQWMAVDGELLEMCDWYSSTWVLISYLDERMVGRCGLAAGGLINSNHEVSLGLIFLLREDHLEREKADLWPWAGRNERKDIIQRVFPGEPTPSPCVWSNYSSSYGKLGD